MEVEYVNAGPAQRADRRYWIYEEPQVHSTGKNAIRYYPQAGKLQFALCDYVTATKDRTTGRITEETKPGRLSALDLDALGEDQDTLKWLLSILQPLVWNN